jgi:hypothetical protein
MVQLWHKIANTVTKHPSLALVLQQLYPQLMLKRHYPNLKRIRSLNSPLSFLKKRSKMQNWMMQLKKNAK